MENARKLSRFNPGAHAKSQRRHFLSALSTTNHYRWIFTFLLLALVIGVSVHLSEEKSFLKLVEEASPL